MKAKTERIPSVQEVVQPAELVEDSVVAAAVIVGDYFVVVASPVASEGAAAVQASDQNNIVSEKAIRTQIAMVYEFNLTSPLCL